MTVPERLFKYQPFDDRSLENVRRRAIWFSRPASFNDPFDCKIRLDSKPISERELERLFQKQRATVWPKAGWDWADRNWLTSGTPNQRYRDLITATAEQYLDEYRRHALHDHGVACFSEVGDSLLMWSHYAQGHRGFCLEFETSLWQFSMAEQVRYARDIPSVSALDDGFFGKGEHFVEMLTMKASCWAYEREWRLFNHRPDSLEELPAGCIKAVHFGAAMPRANKEQLASMLAGLEIGLHEFGPSCTAFGLESQPYMS